MKSVNDIISSGWENCLGNFHSSCRIEFPIYSISLLFSLSTGTVPSNLVHFFENLSNGPFENPFLETHRCVRERERVHAKFLTLHSPLFLRSGSRRWRYHYSVAVISVACGGTTLAREIKTSGFYVAWDDGSWPVYWSWPPLRAGTRRGALSLLARVARSSSRLGSAPLLVATLRNKRSKIELIECQSSYSGLFVLFVFVLINLFYSRLYCYMSRRLSFLFRICFY